MSKTFKGETLVGKKFGNWVVLEFIPDDTSTSNWKCQCICGTIRNVRKDSLTKGKSKSCGCSIAPNIIGQKFDKLTILKRIPTINGNHARYLCKCECGTEKEIDARKLREGTTKACGCDIGGHNKLDLTNLIFGKLRAIHPMEKRSINGSIEWYCECECGKTKAIPASLLNKKRVTSCGCDNQVYELVGKHFGKLTVLEKTNKRINGKIMWKCVCDCITQTIHYVDTSNLISGRVKSCGCLNSVGELNIRYILKKNNISYKPEYKFIELIGKGNKPLRFDFGVVDSNEILKYLIEFDGPQHERNVFSKTNQEFYTTLEHDQLKNTYCFNNNIPLIRIPYKERDTMTVEMLKPETSQYLLRN